MSKNDFNLVSMALLCMQILLFRQSQDHIPKHAPYKVIYKAGYWDCDELYAGKAKQRCHDRNFEHFKAFTKSDHSSTIPLLIR